MKYCLLRSCLLLVFISISAVTAGVQKKVIGLGMSDSKAGKDFNVNLARSQAHDFIAEQTKVATFIYKKIDNGFEFTRIRNGSIKSVKLVKTIPLGGQGVVVFVEAMAEVPQIDDALCKKASQKITGPGDMDFLLSNLLRKTVIKLIDNKYRGKDVVRGESFMRDLTIKKLWGKTRYKIMTTVCIANVRDRLAGDR